MRFVVLLFFIAIRTKICHNIYVFLTHLLFFFLSMQTLDLSTALAPVINISDVPTLEAFLRAQTAEKVHITIENTKAPGSTVIPVRIVEGMEDIANRGTATKKEFALLSSLVSLMRESPLLRA